MTKKDSGLKTGRIAWGITGAGDKLAETVGVMRRIKEKGYSVDVFISEEGETVLKWYKQFEEVNTAFDSCIVESGPNAPFILGDLQTGKYDALIISPATANTVAKIVGGIADTLLTNAVAQTAKTDVPIYIYPVDQKKGKIQTQAPGGRRFTLKMREIDIENSKKLKKMENIKVLKSPEKLKKYFK
ncbi:MAG: archaeoflavoprotein AfpA [Methanosarcinales archaeon]|jgi:archaeoflavoprotein AfpA|nr:archaeoflavoprotein AfpA [Methanosarcinales archaeon]